MVEKKSTMVKHSGPRFQPSFPRLTQISHIHPISHVPQFISYVPVRGMSLRNVTSLGSNLVFVTDLKRIETPHSLCCDFGGYKTLQLVGQAALQRQSSSLSPSLSPCWSSGNLFEGCSRR